MSGRPGTRETAAGLAPPSPARAGTTHSLPLPMGKGQVQDAESWSGAGSAARADVSTDRGATWHGPAPWTRPAGRSRPQVTMSRIRGQLADAEVRHLVTKV